MFCLVGVARNYQLSPRSVAGGSIHVYRSIHGGQGLELIHRTALDEVPYAICPFQNKVLIGMFLKIMSSYECVLATGLVQFTAESGRQMVSGIQGHRVSLVQGEDGAGGGHLHVLPAAQSVPAC
jgi:splicing factor 3B subunit 3